MEHLKYDVLQCGHEVVHKPRDAGGVATTAAALARFLYKHVFQRVVARINTSLAQAPGDSTQSSSVCDKTIGEKHTGKEKATCMSVLLSVLPCVTVSV